MVSTRQQKRKAMPKTKPTSPKTGSNLAMANNVIARLKRENAELETSRDEWTTLATDLNRKLAAARVVNEEYGKEQLSLREELKEAKSHCTNWMIKHSHQDNELQDREREIEDLKETIKDYEETTFSPEHVKKLNAKIDVMASEIEKWKTTYANKEAELRNRNIKFRVLKSAFVDLNELCAFRAANGKWYYPLWASNDASLKKVCHALWVKGLNKRKASPDTKPLPVDNTLPTILCQPAMQ